jgi:hypothetical protein
MPDLGRDALTPIMGDDGKSRTEPGLEDDRPRQSKAGVHEVEGHERVVDGRAEHVRPHEAANPKRKRSR